MLLQKYCRNNEVSGVSLLHIYFETSLTFIFDKERVVIGAQA
jgi:hypothetical protein